MRAPYKYNTIVNGVDIPSHTVTWVAYWYTPIAGVLGQKPRHLYSRQSWERRVILRVWLIDVLNLRKITKGSLAAQIAAYQFLFCCIIPYPGRAGGGSSLPVYSERGPVTVED